MGLEVAAVTLAGVAVGAEVLKANEQIKAADLKENALALQAKEMQLQTQQKTLQNYDVMEKVIAAQKAHMTTTGTSFNSPSFNAIQRNTVNIAGKEGRNIETEGELQEENLDIEKANVKNSLYAQLFGDVVETASNAATFATKVPTTKG